MQSRKIQNYIYYLNFPTLDFLTRKIKEREFQKSFCPSLPYFYIEHPIFRLDSYFLKVTCDFKTQKIWIFLWLGLNILAIITLIIAEILPLVNVGWWSMTSPKNSPILVTTFFMVLILLVLLIYGQIIGKIKDLY